ncbi:hypothetical protein AAIB33_06445 [Microbacterium sp. AZCO]|uniref:hypothetical protein n=1 Tax=Microbacterium sp. AZCO TaxID=3142976 RepID=UPI0031F3B39B
MTLNRATRRWAGAGAPAGALLLVRFLATLADDAQVPPHAPLTYLGGARPLRERLGHHTPVDDAAEARWRVLSRHLGDARAAGMLVTVRAAQLHVPRVSIIPLADTATPMGGA